MFSGDGRFFLGSYEYVDGRLVLECDECGAMCMGTCGVEQHWKQVRYASLWSFDYIYLD